MERAHQIVREVFYPIKMFSHCLIYFQDLEALAVSELGQSQRYVGWRILQKQFLTEFDKLKQQRGTVVIASSTHPQRLHSDFFRPGRLDKQIDLYKPVQLLREEEKHLLLPQASASCPSCKKQVQSTWKYCVYCRIPLTKRCQKCGTAHPEIAGARFCPECANDLS
jgi:AAA+ superfamily predicted ATPase